MRCLEWALPFPLCLTFSFVNHLTFITYNKHKQTKPKLCITLPTGLAKGFKSQCLYLIMSSVCADHQNSVSKFLAMRVKEQCYFKRTEASPGPGLGSTKSRECTGNLRFKNEACVLYLNTLA